MIRTIAGHALNQGAGDEAHHGMVSARTVQCESEDESVIREAGVVLEILKAKTLNALRF
jgi:hypothetical protein